MEAIKNYALPQGGRDVTNPFHETFFFQLSLVSVTFSFVFSVNSIM